MRKGFAESRRRTQVLQVAALQGFANREVCAGRMSLEEGQAIFLGDWDRGLSAVSSAGAMIDVSTDQRGPRQRAKQNGGIRDQLPTKS